MGEVQNIAESMEKAGYTRERAREWFPDVPVITGHLTHVFRWLAHSTEADAGVFEADSLLDADRPFALALYGLWASFSRLTSQTIDGVQTTALARLFDDSFGDVAENSAPIVYSIKNQLLGYRGEAELAAEKESSGLLDVIHDLHDLLAAKLVVLMARLTQLQEEKNQAGQARQAMSGVLIVERYQSKSSQLHAGLSTKEQAITGEETALAKMIGQLQLFIGNLTTTPVPELLTMNS